MGSARILGPCTRQSTLGGSGEANDRVLAPLEPSRPAAIAMRSRSRSERPQGRRTPSVRMCPALARLRRQPGPGAVLPGIRSPPMPTAAAAPGAPLESNTPHARVMSVTLRHRTSHSTPWLTRMCHLCTPRVHDPTLCAGPLGLHCWRATGLPCGVNTLACSGKLEHRIAPRGTISQRMRNGSGRAAVRAA